MSMGGGAEAMGGGASMGGAEADLGAMTEEEQIAYAIQMSMAESAAPSDPTTPAAQPEPMEDGELSYVENIFTRVEYSARKSLETITFYKISDFIFRLISTRN